MAQGTAVESSLPDNDLPADAPYEPDAAGDDAPDVAEAAVEARAREMGWKPLAQYRGPPGRWQPAADFVRRGEEELPIVRDRARRLEEKVNKLEGEISGLRLTAEEQLTVIKDLRDMGQRANQAGYDRAMKEIKANQRKAVEAGDTAAYDQLVEQAEALAESRPVAVAPAPVPPERQDPLPAPRAPALTPTTNAFIGENPWFSTDKLLSDTMVAFHNEVLAERQVTQAALNADPALDRELLEEAKGRVMERYPERFDPVIDMARRAPTPRPTAPRRRAASVAAPTPTSGSQQQPSGTSMKIDSIQDPAERAQAREAFTRTKRQMPDYTEAEYMALYSDPHGDVLALQTKRRSQPNGRQ